MATYFKEKKYTWFFVIALSVTFLLLGYILNDYEHYDFAHYDTLDIQDGWTYEFEDGTTGTTSLPATLEAGKNGEQLTLKKQLPQIKQNMDFIYQSRHTPSLIYLDDELVYDQLQQAGVEKKTSWFTMEGIVYDEVILTPEDSGKTITIVNSCEVDRILKQPGRVYLGDRSDFLLLLLRENTQTLVGAFITIVFALVLLIIWLVLTVISRERHRELLDLFLFTFLIACWQFTESQCLQFFFHHLRFFTVLGYEFLMLIPAPMFLYFYNSEESNVKSIARYGIVISVGTWAICNVMHLLGWMHLGDTLRLVQAMLVVEIVLVLYTQIKDLVINYRKTEDKRVIAFKMMPAGGMAIMAPLFFVEIILYMRRVPYTSNTIFTTIAVVVYIMSLALQSVYHLAFGIIEARSANETKSQFLANMSHEIRTPLNAILGFDEMILRDSKDETIKEHANSIKTAGESLLEIINSILDFSKIESGKLEIHEVGYSTAQFLDSIVSLISPLAKSKGLELYLDIDRKLPAFLMGDNVNLRQVLVNLLNNAVKYTKEGSVTLTMRLLEVDKEKGECEIFFAIKDTGIGIREEDKERLFTKFERLDIDKNRGVEGTGLGMSIVYNVLSAMGSKVELESVYGEGSTFYFTIKQKVIGKSVIDQYEVGMSSAMGQTEDHNSLFIAPEARVLLVDDVPLNIQVTMGLLAKTQMQVDYAYSGLDAIALVKENRYDLILMDHMMPEMDGVEATQKIRTLAEETGEIYFATVPVLALTANAVTGMRELFLDNGMQDFISKPVDGKHLMEVVEKWLPDDKLVYVDAQEDEKESVWDIQIDGINMDAAKKFFASQEEYVDTLVTFMSSFEWNYNRLKNFAEQKDFSNFTIVIHGLKSSAKLIGATEMYELALAGEEKGHQKDDSVWDDVEAFLISYDTTIANISQYIKAEEDKLEATELFAQAYQEAIEELLELAEDFDTDGVVQWEKEYAHVLVEEKNKEQWAKIKLAIADMSFLGIIEAIEVESE